jgi:uncharacterized membrane protein required for colicin V production
MIDILIIIAMLLAFYIGYRRGFIVSLIHLVGIYLATLIAPTIAEPIGSMFMGDNKYLAFIAGFFLVVAAAILILWFVAPILGKFIMFLNPFKKLDKILGGVLNFVVMLVVTAGLFAAFDYANISSHPNVDTITAYVNEKVNSGERITQADVMAFANGDVATMRKIFKPRFVDYETLDSSTFFNALANFGRAITPSLESLNESVCKEAKEGINKETFLN